MKLAIPPTILAAGLALAACQTSFAATVILDDTFDDGTLETNPGTGGGFTYLDNGQGTGTATEGGSLARITEAGGSSTAGIISNNAFDLSDNSLTYTTTWEVGSADFGSSGDIERIFLSMQTNADFIFAGGAEESRLLVEINAQSNSAYLRYQNRSGGSNSNFTTSLFDLGVFNGDLDGFTAMITFDLNGFAFATSGLDATNQVNISDTWANLGTDFATAFQTDGDMHLSGFIQDRSTTGATLDFDRIMLTSVPEPGTALLSAIGVLALLRRRR